MEKILLRREKVLIAVEIGEELLKNGGEVYRVDDTVKRILSFYGFKDFNVYIISNGIFVTVDENGESPISCVRNIPGWSINLGKIAELNKLSREICSGNCKVESAQIQLEHIKNMPPKSQTAQCIATGIGSAAFSFIFGGSIPEMLAAFCIGIVLKLFLSHSEKKHVSKFIMHIVGSSIVCIMAVLASHAIPDLLVNEVIIGSIMILVPGVALTTSIRDFFSGDYLSGSIHLIDALLTAVCIAAGVGVAMKVFILIGWV